MKKLISVILTFTLLLGVFPSLDSLVTKVSATEIQINSGTADTNIYWEMSYDPLLNDTDKFYLDGQLTLSPKNPETSAKIINYTYTPSDMVTVSLVDTPWGYAYNIRNENHFAPEHQVLMRSIILNEGITEIGEYAFALMYDTKTLYLPVSLTYISPNAFFRSPQITDIYYSGSKAQWNAIIGYPQEQDFSNITVHYNSDYSNAIGDDSNNNSSTEILTPVLDKINNLDNGLTISWLRPLNTEDTEYVADGYYVYRKISGGSYSKIATLSGIDNTSYTDTNVTAGTKYTYTVAAYYNGKTGSRNETGLSATFVGSISDVTTSPLLPEDPIVRGDGTTAYINDHIYFAKSNAYYDRMNSRFSGLLLEDQTGMDDMAAEMLYLLIDSGASLSKLNFQNLCIFKNPYEAVLAEILLDLTDLNYDSSDSCSLVPLEVANVAQSLSSIVYAVQPDYEISEPELLPLLETLVEDPKTLQERSPALYSSLENIFKKYMNQEGAETLLAKISGSAKFFSKVDTAVDLLSTGMDFYNWFQESCQFTVMVNTYAALTQESYDALYQAAANMTNTYYKDMLMETLKKLESCTDEDTIGARLFAEIYGGYAKTLYDTVASGAMYVTAADLVADGLGISLNKLHAGVLAYNFGWTISNSITGNDKVMVSREYIRADAYLAMGAYNEMVSDRQKMLSTKKLDDVKAFDASYRLLRALEAHALNAYEEYLDASQKSFGQYLLHFGDTNFNGYELAIAGREIVAWQVAKCHGVEVYASPAAQILIPKTAVAKVVSGSDTVLQVSSSSVTSSLNGAVVSDAGDAWLITLPSDNSYSLKLSSSGDISCAVTTFNSSGKIVSQAVYNDLSSGSTVNLTESGSTMNCTVKSGSQTVQPSQKPSADEQVLPDWATGEKTSTAALPGKTVLVDDSAMMRVRYSNSGRYILTIKGTSVISSASTITGISYTFKDGKICLNITKGSYNLEFTGSTTSDITVQEGDSSGTLTREVVFSNVKLSDDKLVLAVNAAAVGQNYVLTQGSKTIKPASDTATADMSFTDVKSSDYFYDPVRWAVENNITSGTSTTKFSPYNACTRAQAVTFLWRAAGSPEPASTKMPFKDVAKGSYYYKAVMWAVEQGITSGTSANKFSPETKCTRAQIVTFLWRADEKSPNLTGSTGFSDVSSRAYYWYPVRWAVKQNITSGTSTNTFSPDADCTRAQIVTFLYRALAM